MRKLILIDSNALVHRAFHALPPTLTSPKGVMTNAVYGFTSVLIKMIKDLKPDYIAATYDLAGPTFRHEEFEDYKAHREKAPNELYAQIPLTKDVLRAFGIPIYEKQGFEADDLIGALAELGKKEKDLQVVIVTGDMDTLQLVDGNKVVVFTLRKGLTDTITYNEEEVIKRYGIKPEQVIDFKGLKGDPSDNIPGVPGVGDKTASSLIQEFGSMEKLYQKIESKDKKLKLSPKLIEKLIENKDQAFFSKKLSTIIRNVDINFNLAMTDWKANLNRENIEKTLREFGFFSLAKRLDEINIGSPNQTILFSQPEIPVSLPDKSPIKPQSKEQRADTLEVLANAKGIIFDIINNVFIFSENGSNAYSLNLTGPGNEKIWQAISLVFSNPKILKTGHDLKPLLKLFYNKGTHPKGIYFDTKIAAYLLKADRKDYELGEMYSNEFGKELRASPEERLRAIGELKSHFLEKMKSDGLFKLFEEIEMPLVAVLAEVELVGIQIDIKSLELLSKSVSKELDNLEADIYKKAGTKFNINSPKQMKEILFERLELKGKVRKTAKGALSTAAEELEKLAEEHPIINQILKYRELQKLKTTYIEPFPKLVNSETGRIYTTLNQTGTVTGRLSSQDPNLQNIPTKTELGQKFRKAFVAPKGFKLVSFDYSQLELRIATHLSGDKKMISAFKQGEDIHTRTAAEIFEVTPEQVTKDMRRQAKAMNFGLLYGMGITGFQRASGVSRERAREFINRYMAEFDGIAKYMEAMKTKAKKDGFVETIYGRRRYLPEINSGMFQLIAQAERMAINMPVQGTEGDFLRIAMARVYNLIHDEFDDINIKMLVQVHDELLFEIRDDLIKKISPKIKEIMETVCELDVPLTVDIKSGINWGVMDSVEVGH